MERGVLRCVCVYVWYVCVCVYVWCVCMYCGVCVVCVCMCVGQMSMWGVFLNCSPEQYYYYYDF